MLNSDEVLRQYAWSNTDLDTPMWMKSDSEYYYYMLDGNKNVIKLVDETGALANNYEYSPFGKLINEVESVEQPFKFSSEYFDSETNLCYYNYRYYDPNTGKWLKRDPIAENGGYNLYGFVGNNPIDYIDLLGLYPSPNNPPAPKGYYDYTPPDNSAIRYDFTFEVDGIVNDKKNELIGIPDDAIVLDRFGHKDQLISAAMHFKRFINEKFAKKKYDKNCHCIERIVLIQHGFTKDERNSNLWRGH
ncbi:RHS repeat-associated core domain-containing protein [Lentisphaerota bacterium WC36G]|nr:RHS repeat-associated core domain-containing protein [Lentisphaerae bacterium WC36]